MPYVKTSSHPLQNVPSVILVTQAIYLFRRLNLFSGLGEVVPTNQSSEWEERKTGLLKNILRPCYIGSLLIRWNPRVDSCQRDIIGVELSLAGSMAAKWHCHGRDDMLQKRQWDGDASTDLIQDYCREIRWSRYARRGEIRLSRDGAMRMLEGQWAKNCS